MSLLESLPPWRIRRREQFVGAFRKAEAERAAGWIVLYACETEPERWRPIVKAELATFLRACASHRELGPILLNPFANLARGFALLVEGGFLRDSGATYEVEESFVERAFLFGHGLRGPLADLASTLAAEPRLARLLLGSVDTARAR